MQSFAHSHARASVLQPQHIFTSWLCVATKHDVHCLGAAVLFHLLLDLSDSFVCNGWHLTTLPLSCSFASDATRTCSSRLLSLTSRDPTTRRSASTLVGLRPADVHHVVVVVATPAKQRNQKTQAAKRTRIIVSRSQTRRHGSHWSSNQALLHTPHMHTPRHFHRLRRPSSRTVLRLHKPFTY